MKLRGRSLGKKARIEIIPMIDVIFFLLVFFMISSLANQKFNSISVNLPKTANTPSSVNQKITISIEASGKISVNQSPVTLESLPQMLAQAMRDLPDETVIINADQGANYGLVVETMNQAKKIGVRKFALLSKGGGS